MSNLANKIRTVAKEHGTTISELAQKLGVMQPALSRTINNPRITLEDMERIAKAIGCSVTDFMKEPQDFITCPHCGKLIRFSKEEGEQ